MCRNENKKLVHRYFEDAPYHPETCDEIFAATFKFHTLQRAAITPQVVESTPQSEKAAYEWLKSVWSADWRMTVDEIIAEGKIAEIWDISDRLWLWQQLGVIPDLKVAILQARESILAHQR